MRRLAIIAIAVVATLAAVAPAGAKDRPGKPEKPTTTTSTTTPAEPAYWTCEARATNGATAWILPDDVDHPYRADGLPACIDVLDDDMDVTTWEVTWSGTTTRDRGFMLVFEEEVHNTVFAEQIAYISTEQPVTMSWTSPGGNLVFVAMPRSGDRWTHIDWIEITPAP